MCLNLFNPFLIIYLVVILDHGGAPDGGGEENLAFMDLEENGPGEDNSVVRVPFLRAKRRKMVFSL